MECLCVDLGEGDGDYPEQGSIEITEPVARKQYKCVECGQVIRRGERHQSFNAVWPGEGRQTIRTCLPCAGIRRDYSPGSNFGALRDDIWECNKVDILGVWEAGDDE